MKNPFVVALVTFLPVLIMATLVPRWLPKALIPVNIIDLGVFGNIVPQMIQWKRDHGPIPFRLRQPMLPWLVGFLCYGLIAFGSLDDGPIRGLAVIGALSIAFSKLWLAKGPFWPRQQPANLS